MTKLIAGKTVNLQVAREVSPYGYFLTNGNQDVLLHYTEQVGAVAVGDQIDVFLYHDTESRLAATMRKPLIQLGEIALLEVADVNARYGCFLEMGLGRNLLLPVRELPELPELRPQIGDKVYVGLAHDKQGRLIAKLAGEHEFEKLVFAAPSLWRNEWLEARVYRPLKLGSFVICGSGVLGFGAIGLIHETQQTKPLRLGEGVRARVTFVRDDGRVNLSMLPDKKFGRSADADKLLEYLRSRPRGQMPYSDETSADILMAKFGMSKAGFKRAIGKLMKEGLVYQRGSWTHLRIAENAEDSDENGNGS